MGLKVKKYPVYGEESNEVLKYQKYLQKTGSKIQLNKKFTIGMITAIKSFQKKNGLKVTGEIDAKTAAALEKVKPAKKTVKK